MLLSVVTGIPTGYALFDIVSGELSETGIVSDPTPAKMNEFFENYDVTAVVIAVPGYDATKGGDPNMMLPLARQAGMIEAFAWTYELEHDTPAGGDLDTKANGGAVFLARPHNWSNWKNRAKLMNLLEHDEIMMLVKHPDPEWEAVGLGLFRLRGLGVRGRQSDHGS